jgi:hypothetical protein
VNDESVTCRNLLGGSKENRKTLSQDKRFLGRDLNPRPPEYEAETLPTVPRHSM